MGPSHSLRLGEADAYENAVGRVAGLGTDPRQKLLSTPLYRCLSAFLECLSQRLVKKERDLEFPSECQPLCRPRYQQVPSPPL